MKYKGYSMIRIFVSLLVILTLTGLSAMASQNTKKSIDRAKLVERIERACLPRVREDFTNAERICKCISEDLGAKLNDSDLELITRSHEEDPAAERELQKEKHNELILKDYDLTQICLRLGKPKPFH